MGYTTAEYIKLQKLQAEKLRRAQYAVYRKFPEEWLKDKLGETLSSIKWSEHPFYEGHNWDGDIDPVFNGWRDVASGHWMSLVSATGCHAKGQKILMFDGTFKKVEEISVGDKLMGDDSKPRNVLSLARGREAMVKVVPHRGESFTVNKSHILSLKLTGGKKIKHRAYPELVNVSVEEYLTWSATRKHHYKLYRVSANFNYKRKLKYDPYFIGLWLGDGSSGSTNITNIDIEIIDYLKNYALQLGAKFTVGKCKDRTKYYAIHYGIKGRGVGGVYIKNPILQFLKTKCLKAGEKHIPFEYLTGSRKQRLELLAGLIDTDGSADGKGFEFSTVFEGLADQVCFLARSLGYYVYKRIKDNAFKGAYRLTITGDCSLIPTKIARKQLTKRAINKDHNLTGFKVEQLPEDNYYGFELDSNHLYLLEDFTVTHNTGKTFFLARLVMWFLDVYDDSLVITTAPREGQLKQNLWAELNNEMEKFKLIRPHSRYTKLNLKPEGNNPSVYVTSKARHEAIGFVTGVGTDEQSATKAQGFHRKDMLIICEEAAGMNGAIMTAFQNTCTGGNNIIVAVGNPDSEFDELHKFSTLPNVKSYRMSALDYPNVVGKSEIIPGAVTTGSITRRKDKYGEDSPLYLSRVRGITPNESDDTLIRRSWIQECTTTHPKFRAKEMEGWNAVGEDIANSENGDKAALVWGKGNKLDHIQEFQCPNATHLAYNTFYEDWELDEKGYRNYHTRKLKDYNISQHCIGIDSVGVGVATLNAYIDLGITAVGLAGKEWPEGIPVDEQDKPLYHFANLRSQMYWELREDFRNGRIVIELDDAKMIHQLEVELCVPKFLLKGGAVTIEGKDSIKKRMGGKSPNVADAVAYWNWIRKGYRAGITEYMNIYGGE